MKRSESMKRSGNAGTVWQNATSNGKTYNLPGVTVDDVIKDLMALFGRLGLDAGHVIKRVKYIHRANRTNGQPITQLSGLSDLLTLWHQNPSFLDPAGNPAPMRMDGRRNSFRKIASIAVPNAPVTRLLRELVRLRAVRVDKEGIIHVRMRSLSIYEDKRLAALHTLNSLRGFINTLHHNLDSPPANSDQLFHRIAWSGEFDKRKIPQLKIWLRRHGQSLLESVDLWMMNQSNARNGKRPRKGVQASVGLYLSVDD